jgi:hypothetical protein
MIFFTMYLTNIYKCICSVRYKVVVIMEYGGHKAEFLFWDKECFQILGVAADTLRKTMQQVNLFLLYSLGSSFNVVCRFYKFGYCVCF